MNRNKLLVYSSLAVFVLALGLFVYLVNASKALSYLSSDPKACINCHVMNPQYATWQHSSHAANASCVECHLPTGSFIEKYISKAKDGWNHSVAFTLGSFDHSMKISADGARRVQENCISCHASLSSTLLENADAYHNFGDPKGTSDRMCWECHQSVPHGEVRSLTSAPNALGVREVK